MPAGQHESRADRLICEAVERGEFDDLAGSGEPLPGVGKPDSPGWWVRRWVESNRLGSLYRTREPHDSSSS